MKVKDAPPNVFLAPGNDFISTRENKDVRFVKFLNHGSRNHLIGCFEVIGFTGDFPSSCLITDSFAKKREGRQYPAASD